MNQNYQIPKFQQSKHIISYVFHILCKLHYKYIIKVKRHLLDDHQDFAIGVWKLQVGTGMLL
jgi:hypothetical protein